MELKPSINCLKLKVGIVISGTSKDSEEVVHEVPAKQRPTTSEDERPRSEGSQRQRTRLSEQSDKHPQAEKQSHRASQADGYDAKVIQITKDGFTTSDVTIMEGQVVTFVWDDTCSPVMSVFQVVSNGESLRPVVGGFTCAPTAHRREYEQLFTLAGEYKFAINTIRCTPFTVVVAVRDDLHANVTDEGFIPAIIDISQGLSINWSWQSCDTPHTVKEVTYVMDKGFFSQQNNKNQSLVATVTGKHRQQFKNPGTYYFRTESSQLGKHHLCVVYVQAVAREHRIEVLDRTFNPMILLVEEGDRVWWSWDKKKCQKLHHVYQIDAPKEGHKEDSAYEPITDGFKWHNNPSAQGLMCHQFRQAGVYYYSDQNFDEAADYIGTIIVKPSPKVHQVEVKAKAFSPDVLYAQTGDRVVWIWDGDTASEAGDNLLILEEDKVLSPELEESTSLPDEKKLQKVDEDAVRLMTKSGHAATYFTNIGLYNYRLSDSSETDSSCSIVVNPGSKNHTIHLTDIAVEPKVLKIRPNDRVWWVWQGGKKQHNIRQVSHEGVPIQDGFSSGLPRDSPSAFHHQFQSPGIFYFESKGLPKIYGAIVVCTQPQVHIVTVDKEIRPDPLIVQMHDVICWVFKQAIRHGIMEVPSVDKYLDATTTEIPMSARCCIAQGVKKLSMTHYYSKSFHRSGKHKKVTEKIKLSSAVCDERSDFVIIRVSTKRGFHPQEIFLEKGKTVKWTWRGSTEQHNIIHVTDPRSEAPLNPIAGSKAFSSGKPVDNNCFVHTFDEPGDYFVASQGAPGYSCIVHIKDEVLQTLEPYNTSEKKGGTVERYYRVDLSTDTEGADIYYTTDGSLPGLHYYSSKHYSKDKGVILKEAGLCFIRAFAVKHGQVCSHVFTSSCYWVLTGEEDANASVEDNSNAVEVEEKQGLSSWDWWNCRPNIKGCFTGPGILNIFWDLPESEAAQQQIKGYQVFLNGVSYCSMFPMTNNSLHIQGLAGSRSYKITVRVYPKDEQNVEIESNSLNLKCLNEVDNGGPLISLLRSEKPDSLTIIWMSIEKPDLPLSGYVIYLNDQQCGPTLVPDAESSRCKVVISSCELNIKYKIHVQAVLANSDETLMSNILEVDLPLDTSHFKYPSSEEMQDEEDLYMEYIQVAEGSGYLPDMDDPDNPIWQTETDTSSAASLDEGMKKKRRRKKQTKILGIPQPNAVSVHDVEIDPDCAPLSSCKQYLTSFPSAQAYSQALLERKSSAGLGMPRSRLGFSTAARIVGRLTCILQLLRASSSYDDEWGSVQYEKVTPRMHRKVDLRTMMQNRTAHFGMTAPGGDYVPDKKSLVTSTESLRARGIIQAPRKRDLVNSTKGGKAVGDNRSYSQMTHRKGRSDRISSDQDSFKRKEDSRRGYDGVQGSSVSRTSDSQDRIFGEDIESSDHWHTGVSTFDSVNSHDRLHSTQSESGLATDRGVVDYDHRDSTWSGRSSNRHLMKQVRFSEAVRYERHPLYSDSSFSDNDASVEHLYMSPQYSKPNVAASFYPADRSQPDHSWRSKSRQEEYVAEMGSDYSNYCSSSREDMIDEQKRFSSSYTEQRLQKLKLARRHVVSVDGPENFLRESSRSNLLYKQLSEPIPCPLPQEKGGMLERYLGYYGVEMETPVVDGEPPGFHSREARQRVMTVEVEQGRNDETTPILSNGVSALVMASADPPLDKQRVYYDATKEEITSPGKDNSGGMLYGEGVGGGSMRGPVVIEVEKVVPLNHAAMAAGDETMEDVSLEKTVMVKVGEGEYVSGNSDALLPSPSIMAESQSKDGMMVAWKMDIADDSEYKIQLFVVNVVGAKFSSNLSSDISFECKMVDKEKSVQGVQHCWNILQDSKSQQHECQVKGLLPEVTYRVYVVANYVMMKGNEPCEAQATSSVLYYTIQGPPTSPTLLISKVDLYSAVVEWDGPELDNGQTLKGYLIFVNGKPLGSRRSPDVKEMVIESLVPGKTLNLFIKAVSEFAEQESQPTRTVHVTCPPRPAAPVISQEPSFKQGCVLISWSKPEGQVYSSNREAISHYCIYVDDKWHGEVKANKLSDQRGYQFYLTDLMPEQGYDISVKAVAGERTVDPSIQHVYCLSESPSSNIVPVMATAAPRSPKLRLEGLHPDGIDVTWQVPQQCGDAVISGYQMLRNGKLYGSVIPPEVTSLHISDITLGEKIELQLIALTEHAVGKGDRKVDIEKDSGKGSSQPGDKVESSPLHKKPITSKSTCLIEFKGMEESIDYSDWPPVLKDVCAGERYTGCKPGPKLVVHYTGLVCAPSEVWCEKVTGHSALIVWKKTSDSKAHFLQPDSYQVTWWPGDRPQDDIQSDSTIEDHLMITGLRPSTMYTVVVEARKIEKYTDFDEEASVAETPDGMNAFILSSKSKQLLVKTSRPPDPPSNVGVVAMTCHSLKVGWDPPKEHGSEIIGIRVECISLDPKKYHHIAVDTLPDCTLAEVAGLHEKTDYCVTVIAVTEEYFYHLPEKHQHKLHHSFPPDVLASQEESQWLPNSSIITRTSGTDPSANIRVIKATPTSITLNWTPPLVHGSNKLNGQIVRWSDVQNSRQSGHEELQIASHVNLLPTEDTVTIDNLLSGCQYKVIIEAVVSVKTTLEPDSWDGSNIERYRRTTHVMSKPYHARTRAPVEPPKVIVMSYTRNSAILYWEKPLLMSMVKKDDDGNPRYLRRYLQGYKLEINGKVQSCMAPDVNSCTLTKCKPGRTYNVVLVAMTCTKEGKQKYKEHYKSVDNQEIDYMTLLQDDEHLDESPSEPVEVTLPKDQDGFLDSLEAKYQHNPGTDGKAVGHIELLWTVQGKANLLKQFNIVWYCMDDRVIQTRFVGPEQRRATVSVTKAKTIYTIKVEPAYYTDTLAQHAQEVQVIVPGPPDAPEIYVKSHGLDEFCIEWGEPKLYGGVKVGGYQVFLNDKKVGVELNANHNKATIPCRPNRTYRVNVVALSGTAGYGNSQKSNTLVVSPSGHSETIAEMDDPFSQDSGIPVKVTKVTESTIHIDWAGFLKTEDLAYHKIQWNSVAQPEPREVKLSERDSNCIINKCLPGTTHFIRLIAYSVSGQILDKSKQLTIQTSAPPDAPLVSVRACNFNYIAVQWEKPTTYGDALITGYKVYVNGIVEAVLNTDQLSYTYTQGKPCQEYVFQVQALTTGDNMSSKPSEPLVVTWPGSRAPAIRHLPSVSSSTVRVGWDDPYLTDGLRIKHFMLYCKEDGTEIIMQVLGPLHASAREGEFQNLKKGSYSLYLEVHVYGSDNVIRSEVMHMEPSLSPDPPQITVTLVGLEERRLVEKFTCDLVNKRDRLIRQVGHKLKKIGALSHPLRAEKNEDVINSAHHLTRIEELLEDCFNVLESYTGQLTAHVSWQCAQTSPEIQLAGFKLLVDGKQYGGVMHAGVRTVRLQLGLEQPSYRLSMLAVSEKPKGVSCESNVVEALSATFKPFTFYCYHIIHRKDVKYPAYGCCKYQDSIRYERQCAKKLANQGLLQNEVPPPSCSLLDVFDGELKPFLSNHSSHFPTAICFWTPWCLSSQKMMYHFVRFAKENTKQVACQAVACGLVKVTAEVRKSLAHTITSNSWREDQVVWHTTSDCASGVKSGQESGKEKLSDITEILGIAGVPSLLFVNAEGHIVWHGRYCALDYQAFEAFMQHALAEVAGQPCPMSNCDCCKGDTTLDEDSISRYMAKLASSGNTHTTSRSLVPHNSSPRSTRQSAWNGSESSISAAECLHMARKQKPGNSGHRVKYSLTVNKRPYSASSMLGMLDKSPYTTCVAPHLHRPHKIKPRPMSAKYFNNTSYKDTQLN